MGWIIIWIVLVVVGAVVKFRSDLKKGIVSSKCLFCGAKLGTSQLGMVTHRTCQRCGRDQPWEQIAEQLK